MRRYATHDWHNSILSSRRAQQSSLKEHPQFFGALIHLLPVFDERLR